MNTYRTLHFTSSWLIFFFGISIFSICTATVSAQNWDQNDYDRYTYQTFDKIEGINSEIDPLHIDVQLLNAAIFYETNVQRVEHQLKALKHNVYFQYIAHQHSNDMVEYNFFSHTSPIQGKRELSDRAKAVGITSTYIGENIALEYVLQLNNKPYFAPSQVGSFQDLDRNPIKMHSYLSLAKTIVNSWMNSPGHRANILNKNYVDLGAGNAFYYKGEGIDRILTVKSTQNFGKL